MSSEICFSRTVFQQKMLINYSLKLSTNQNSRGWYYVRLYCATTRFRGTRPQSLIARRVGFLLKIFTMETSNRRSAPPTWRQRKKSLSELAGKEEHLTSILADKEQELFTDYVATYIKFSSLCNADSFTVGFRLGSRFTYDTFIDNKKGWNLWQT